MRHGAPPSRERRGADVKRSLVIGALLLLSTSVVGADYDPFRLREGEIVEIELEVHDAARSREVPLRVYLPAADGAAPVVLFSHGLGGSRDGNAYLGRHWAGRGFAALFLQHPGSDETVWKEAPRERRMDSMREAANLANFRLRVGDVVAVIDRLEPWNTEHGHRLAGRLDLDRIGMSGRHHHRVPGRPPPRRRRGEPLALRRRGALRPRAARPLAAEVGVGRVSIVGSRANASEARRPTWRPYPRLQER